MMVKLFFILIAVLLSAHIPLPTLQESFSENKKYQILISPKYCNDQRCLNYDEMEELEVIPEEFNSQKILLYKRKWGRYRLHQVFDVDEKELYFLSEYHYLINNHGKVLIVADHRSLRWKVFSLQDDKPFLEKSLRGEEIFHLKMTEYANCLRDFASISSDGCRIETKLEENKLVVKFRWFDFEMNDYRDEKYEYMF
jgi:hypothetical protein